MHAIVARVSGRKLAAWNAVTGECLPVQQLDYRAPPLWHPQDAALDGPPPWLALAAPLVTLTLEDGTVMHPEHTTFVLGRCRPSWRTRVVTWLRKRRNEPWWD